MAKRRPRIDASIISEAGPPPIEPETKFSSRMVSLSHYAKDTPLNDAWLAFDMLELLRDAKASGLEHKQLSKYYPNEEWKNRAIAVPEKIVEEIVKGWQRFIVSDSLTLGQAFDFERVNRQGAKPVKSRLRKAQRERVLAAETLSIYCDLVEGDQVLQSCEVSLEFACSEVAEAYGVSLRTVERAFSKHRDILEKALSATAARQNIEKS